MVFAPIYFPLPFVNTYRHYFDHFEHMTISKESFHPQDEFLLPPNHDFSARTHGTSQHLVLTYQPENDVDTQPTSPATQAVKKLFHYFHEYGLTEEITTDPTEEAGPSPHLPHHESSATSITVDLSEHLLDVIRLSTEMETLLRKSPLDSEDTYREKFLTALRNAVNTIDAALVQEFFNTLLTIKKDVPLTLFIVAKEANPLIRRFHELHYKQSVLTGELSPSYPIYQRFLEEQNLIASSTCCPGGMYLTTNIPQDTPVHELITSIHETAFLARTTSDLIDPVDLWIMQSLLPHGLLQALTIFYDRKILQKGTI